MIRLESKPLIIITGPTACGKTFRAVELALTLGDAEIISADSRQLYCGMDIGTGKDLDEYKTVPYHMIDIVPAGSKYNLYEYLRDANMAIKEVESRNCRPIVCGGTGLYIESLVNGIQLPEVPENKELRDSLKGKDIQELTEILAKMKTLHNVTDIDTRARAIRAIEIQTYYINNPQAAALVEPKPRNAIIIAINIGREDRRRRITERLRHRLNNGMLDEIRKLIESGIAPDDLIYYGLEYKFLTLHILGKLSYDEMFSSLEIAIHQFAKRQMTWFRGMERRGHILHWIDYDDPEFVSKMCGLIL